MIRKHWSRWLAALVAAGLTLLVTLTPLLDIPNAWICDPLYQQGTVPDPAIRILAIDEKTIAAYGEPALWSRDLTARLVETLNADPATAPAVIALDLLYPSSKDEAGDARLAEAAQSGGNVVTAVNLVFRNRLTADAHGLSIDTQAVSQAEYPYAALKEASRWGFANTELDTDQSVRRARLYAEAEGERVYAFAVQVYRAWQGEDAPLPKTDDSGICSFAYTGKSGSYEVISMTDVLEGGIDPRVFTDSVVLVGAYAPGMQDAYSVPIQRGQEMYGVEIHANLVQALAQNRTAIKLARWIYAVAAALIAFLFYLLIGRLPLLAAGLSTVGLIAAELITGLVAFTHGLEIRLIELLLCAIALFLTRLVSVYLSEILHRKRILSAFRQYVAPQVVDELTSRGSYEIQLGGERRSIAVLFVDIRGFTPMSEGLEPETVVEILNEYLELTTQAIFSNGGTLDKFIGDATMAVFNAPFDLDDYVFRAVCTARDIARGHEALEKRLMERFGKSISYGIGVNCGDAVVGNIGCDFRMDYTAIGDTVNTAARLESNAGRGQILLSQAVYEAVKDRIRATEIGVIPLKGKSQEVFVYQLDEVLDDGTAALDTPTGRLGKFLPFGRKLWGGL